MKGQKQIRKPRKSLGWRGVWEHFLSKFFLILSSLNIFCMQVGFLSLCLFISGGPVFPRHCESSMRILKLCALGFIV